MLCIRKLNEENLTNNDEISFNADIKWNSSSYCGIKILMQWRNIHTHMDVNVNNLININNLRKNELYGRVYHGGMTSKIGYVKFQRVIWYDITRIINIQLMISTIVMVLECWYNLMHSMNFDQCYKMCNNYFSQHKK